MFGEYLCGVNIDRMKKYCFLLFFLSDFLWGYAQVQQDLTLNREEIEALFLKNNLELIVERYNVDIADAVVAQAKLWDNPSLAVSGVNLWSSRGQKEEIQEMATSSFLRNTELSVELSQLLLTANKRGKLVQREMASKEMALWEFEEVLRGLKVELRKSVCSIRFSQAYLEVLMNQQRSVDQLVEVYKRQTLAGNIAKSELLRLQSALIELDDEINEVRMDLTEQEKTLKVLVNVSPLVRIRIAGDAGAGKVPDELVLADLWQLADESRPDVKRYASQTRYHQKSLAYEKSLRIPDVTFSANYDRYGGVWKDFVGFGVSIDLPFLNRNQGNIRSAKLSLAQSRDMAQLQQNTVRHEVTAALSGYVYSFDFYEKISKDSLLPELDDMLDVYTKNLLNKNISMLEYLDFMEAYKTNKRTMLAAEKNVNIQFEELQYRVGTELK